MLYTFQNFFLLFSLDEMRWDEQREKVSDVYENCVNLRKFNFVTQVTFSWLLTSLFNRIFIFSFIFVFNFRVWFCSKFRIVCLTITILKRQQMQYNRQQRPAIVTLIELSQIWIMGECFTHHREKFDILVTSHCRPSHTFRIDL